MIEQPHAEHYRHNYEWWQERASLHPDTTLYQRHLAALRSGGVSLHEMERSEVGDVSGKRLLHLQCHVGTDTLSWARLGAEVTGVDFSEIAIEQSRRFSTELELPATFVHSDIYEARQNVPGTFDVVYTSYGTIIWLHDLTRWATNIAQFLRPGGFFYIIDGHPMALAIDENFLDEPLLVRLAYPYFPMTDPLRFDDPGTYAQPDIATRSNITYEWMHNFAEILMSLIQAGLIIEHFAEHRVCAWEAFPCCRRGEDNLYRLPEHLSDRIPLLFSLRARKPQT